MTEPVTLNNTRKVYFKTGILKNKDGSTYLPPTRSITEQIKDNAEIIRTLREDIKKHAKDAFPLTLALNSSVNHQNRLLEIFAFENGVSDYVAMSIDTMANKLLSISARKLTTLVTAVEDLMRACLVSYKRQNKRRNIDFSLDFCLPFESSFGYFLLPRAKRTKKTEDLDQVHLLNTIVKDAVIIPFYEILSKSCDENTLQGLFDKWGSEVANEYEKYVRIISEQNISLSMYSENHSFYANKKLADSILNKMATNIEEAPLKKTFSGKIYGILTYAGKRQATFARDGERRIDASFPAGLEKKILELYECNVNATFNHRKEKKAVSGKINEEWELIKLDQIK